MWKRQGVQLITSAYAAEEARRNLDAPDQRARLGRLLADVRLVPESQVDLPGSVRLPANDEPILRAAIAAGATHLITGDLRDFGKLLGQRVAGILVQTPGEFLKGLS